MAQARGYTATKDQLRDRLARVEGQVRGVARMVEEDRYCADILTQISSVQEAMRAVSRLSAPTIEYVKVYPEWILPQLLLAPSPELGVRSNAMRMLFIPASPMKSA